MKKVLLILPFFLIAPNAFASQVIFGGNSSIGTVTAISPLDGAGATLSNVAFPNSDFPVPGTLSNCSEYVTFAPGGAATRVFALGKKGAVTTNTCTIGSAAQSCTDNTDVIPVAAHDTFYVSNTVTGTPANASASWACIFTPTNQADSVLLAQSNSVSNTLEQFYQLSQGLAASTATETNAGQNIPEAGTIDFLTASTSNGGPGAGTSYDLSLRLNQASTTLTANVSGTNSGADDLVDVVAVVPSDVVNIASNPNSTPAAVRTSVGLRYRAAIQGDFALQGSTGTGSDTAGATRYLPINGTLMNPVEASTTQISKPMTITTMSVTALSASGAGHTLTVTLRDNSADTSLTCNVSGATQKTATCTGNIKIKDGDLVDTSLTLDAGGTINRVWVSYAGYTGERGKMSISTGGKCLVRGTGALLIGN